MSDPSIRSRAPQASSLQVRKRMEAVASADTAAEVLLRRALHAAGLRFRKNCRPVSRLRCEADVVFRRQAICIFVDGCFWHRCPEHYAAPQTNAAWWAEKITANVERDRRQTAELEKHGWTVVRVWEHELEPDQLSTTVESITQLVRHDGRPKT